METMDCKKKAFCREPGKTIPEVWHRHTKQEDGMETGNPIQKYCFLSISTTVEINYRYSTNKQGRKEAESTIVEINYRYSTIGISLVSLLSTIVEINYRYSTLTLS